MALMSAASLAEAVLRHPRRFLMAMAACLLVAVAAAWLLPPRYRASALVKAEWEGGRGTAAPGPELVRRRLDRVTSWALGDAAVATVLAEVRGRPGKAPSRQEIEDLRSTVDLFARGPDAFLIESVQPEPARAAFVSNRLASLLVADADRQRAVRSEGDPRRLEARLGEARRALEGKEAALSRARERRVESAAPPANAGTTSQRRLEIQRRAAADAAAAARERAAGLEEAVSGESQAPAEDGQRSDELTRLRSELVELRTRYTEQHPDVEALTRRIRRLEAQVVRLPEPTREPESERLRSDLGRIQAEIEELDREVARLDAEIARVAGPDHGSKHGDRPPPQQDLAGLTRDLEQSRAAYQSLLEEWRAAQTTWRQGSSLPPRLEILERARVPPRPSFPDRRLFGLAGLAVGLALGLWSALSAERRDPSVKGRRDLQALFSQPVLAVIPLVRARRRTRASRAPSAPSVAAPP